MDSSGLRFDKAFIERQRQRLRKLRDELVDAARAEEAEEEEVNSQSNGQAGEYEDDAQRLTKLELDGILVARNVLRLKQVRRALEKISEGTYGLSDASNQPIPKGRLEGTPESIYTVAEQATRESTRLRGTRQKQQSSGAAQAGWGGHSECCRIWRRGWESATFDSDLADVVRRESMD